jgi:MFS family permease
VSYQEKNAWIYVVLAVVIPTIYFVNISGQLATMGAADVQYQQPLLLAIGASIAVAIVFSIVLGMLSGKNGSRKDQRDTDINRLGEYVTGIVVGAGMIGPFLLALVESDHFWIANAMYLVFVLGALVGTTVKLVAYRRGL